LCESSAGRRIAAARVCRQFPEAFVLIAKGALHISALCSLKPYLNGENATELFELCGAKSARRVEELLATRFPKPDVRDSIRRLPMQRATPDAGSNANGPPILEDTTTQHSPKTPLEGARDSLFFSPADSQAARLPGPPPRAAAGRIEPLSADRFGVHFTADTEFRELLERVRGLAGHRLPSGDPDPDPDPDPKRIRRTTQARATCPGGGSARGLPARRKAVHVRFEGWAAVWLAQVPRARPHPALGGGRRADGGELAGPLRCSQQKRGDALLRQSPHTGGRRRAWRPQTAGGASQQRDVTNLERWRESESRRRRL